MTLLLPKKEEIYYGYPFSNNVNENGKVYPPQKVTQIICDIYNSEIEQRRLRIQKHPERTLYLHAEEENFVVNRHQIALLFDDGDRFITTCINGKGKLKLKDGKKMKENNDEITALKLWNNMKVLGITRTGLDTTDTRKQPQVNVIIHGDACIRNNSPDPWHPNEKLIAILPSPKLYHNIRFQDYPEHAFYPIIEPLDCNKHPRFIMNFVYHYLIREYNNNHNQNKQKSKKYPIWVHQIAEKQLKIDITKGLALLLHLNPDQGEKEMNDWMNDSLFSNASNKEVLEKENKMTKANHAFIQKMYNPNLNDDEEKNIEQNKKLFSESFVQYEIARSKSDEKIVGKVVTPTRSGEMGSIIVNNLGITKGTTSDFNIDKYYLLLKNYLNYSNQKELEIKQKRRNSYEGSTDEEDEEL